ncbi:voltage-dependent T-type calcium channel subunit alpha-1G-like [Homarus americanus]|uniref:voltage-dependent T-type calcium channel subunit alpha-1G-like n=1 Tax=Homarus americanus TaxID=6706 RepID=UPI001C44A11D|nr:voltage-dependent T-type calcium channel subunit alpha-1G-like [Homarus americanus]
MTCCYYCIFLNYVITWFERLSMFVILLNCVTLGMYRPCVDEICDTNRCKILQMFDDAIFAFFAVEMVIKMVAMGWSGKGAYMADSWNRLDLFIVVAGSSVLSRLWVIRETEASLTESITADDDTILVAVQKE